MAETKVKTNNGWVTIGGDGIVVDNEMSSTSTNSAQNKIVKQYVDENSPALGETLLTAYRGDRGKEAYDNMHTLQQVGA